MEMSKKIESANGTSIVLLTLYDVATRLDSSGYQLRQWIENDQIVTPTPDFKLNSNEYWTEESLPAWKVLVDKENERIASMSWTKEQLLDLLIQKAKITEGIAKAAFNRGRGNYSLSGARLKVVELEGQIEFVTWIGERGLRPAEKREELLKHLRGAKEALSLK
jgi:hypothetical protein